MHFVPKSRCVARLLNVYFYFYQNGVRVRVSIVHNKSYCWVLFQLGTLLLYLQGVVADARDARALFCASQSPNKCK